MITLGNHTYRHRDVYAYLDSEQRIVRPANFPAANPGRGHTIVDAAGMRVAVVNLSGQLHLRVERSPFPSPTRSSSELKGRADAVDRRLPRRADQREGRDGLAPRRPRRGGARHPHPRPDRRRAGAPGGTAHITDVGMTGSRAGVIGVRREQALQAFRTQMPVRFDTADEDIWVMGAAVEVGDDGLARPIAQCWCRPVGGVPSRASSATNRNGRNQGM